MPKPSVALCKAKPMIRTVASPISPARAETPIARPSAKLWTPIAVAMIRPSAERGPRAALASTVKRSLIGHGERVGCAARDWGRSGALGRMRRSRIPRPALPRAKPPTSSRASATAWPKLPVPSL